jgi:hypothetical protein
MKCHASMSFMKVTYTDASTLSSQNEFVRRRKHEVPANYCQNAREPLYHETAEQMRP